LSGNLLIEEVSGSGTIHLGNAEAAAMEAGTGWLSEGGHKGEWTNRPPRCCSMPCASGDAKGVEGPDVMALIDLQLKLLAPTPVISRRANL
jgi:hypothetical protein